MTNYLIAKDEILVSQQLLPKDQQDATIFSTKAIIQQASSFLKGQNKDQQDWLSMYTRFFYEMMLNSVSCLFFIV